jgi:hypothetical protein
MKGIGLWIKTVLMCMQCVLVVGTRIEASEASEATAIVIAFEGRVAEVAEGFEREAGRLRKDYENAMLRLGAAKRDIGSVPLQLWAQRNLRICRESETEALALLEEAHALPEEVAKVNADTKDALKTLREKALVALAEAKQSSLMEMKELEKRQVRLNKIDQAVLTRQALPLIETAKSHTKAENRIKGHTPARAYVEIRKRDKKREWDPVPPPDAEFPFRKENPAFQALLTSVVIESSGFRDGPSARIALGNVVTHVGTRGLSVVALYGDNVLIQDSYDTHAFEEESQRLIRDLKALPYGAFLMLAVRDDATRRFTGSANSTLIRFGAKQGIHGLPYRSSYLLIGIKGLAPGEAVEMQSLDRISFKINP